MDDHIPKDILNIIIQYADKRKNNIITRFMS